MVTDLKKQTSAIRAAEEKQAGFPAALLMLRDSVQEMNANVLAMRHQSNMTMNIHAIVRF
jgi:hypothetical protein